METIFELCFLTEDNEMHNLLYKNAKDADLDKKKYYYEGRKHDGKTIICSYVISRILF